MKAAALMAASGAPAPDARTGTQSGDGCAPEDRAGSLVILYGAFECHVNARTAFRSNRNLALSPREFELFRCLMENAGEVVTRTMLLRDVWKMSFDPQTNVVDVSIGRLRRKLEDGFERPALETIWGTGYRLLDGQ